MTEMVERRPRASTGGVLERKTSAGTVYAMRFRAEVELGDTRCRKRFYVTLGSDREGWTRSRAERELDDTLTLVRKGLWSPPGPAPAVELSSPEPTLSCFAEMYASTRAGVTRESGNSPRKPSTCESAQRQHSVVRSSRPRRWFSYQVSANSCRSGTDSTSRSPRGARPIRLSGGRGRRGRSRTDRSHGHCGCSRRCSTTRSSSRCSSGTSLA